MATIVHFDISVDDTERARAFYQQLFGWKIEKFGPMDYYMIQTSDLEGKPGLGGGMAKREAGSHAGVTNFIGVASMNKTLEQIAQLGGKVLSQPQPVPGYGTMALCMDTENNVFGIFEETR